MTLISIGMRFVHVMRNRKFYMQLSTSILYVNKKSSLFLFFVLESSEHGWRSQHKGNSVRWTENSKLGAIIPSPVWAQKPQIYYFSLFCFLDKATVTLMGTEGHLKRAETEGTASCSLTRLTGLSAHGRETELNESVPECGADSLWAGRRWLGLTGWR